MVKIMKNFIYILNIIIASLFFASCEDEGTMVLGDDEPCYTILVSAPNVSDTRAYYKEDGENIAVVWENGDIVILDEPVNAVDEEGIKVIREILDELKKEGKIIILACHDKEELFFLSDEIIEIDCGVIKRQYAVGSKLEDSKEDLED